MKLELKKVRIVEQMSEETTCFHAILYVNGKKAADCLNSGTGGMTDVNFYDKDVQNEVANVSDASNEVSFELNHAQTAVNVKVVREENYTGAGVVTALSVKSEGLAHTGVFSAVDGVWDEDEFDGVNEAIAIANSFTLSPDNVETTNVAENEKENPYMLIPASAEVKPFVISATLDGKPYNVTVNMTEAFAAGKVYKISVKMTNVGLVVDSVVVLEDWQPSELAPGTLAPQS